MDADRWNRVAGVLASALELPADDRAEFLTARCDGDPDLHAEVIALLAEHAEGESDEELFEFRAGGAPASPGVRTRRSFGGPVLRPGDRFGGYEVIEPLGAGGVGFVHRAEQITPRRNVALKVLASTRDSSVTLSRFRQESDALARLDHPGIVRVFDAGTCEFRGEEVPYLAMEYHAGGTLRERIESGSGLSLSERIELGAQLAEAVQHAHSSGVIHRDLKPENILFGRDGRPRVADFGLARWIDEDVERWTHTGELLGTLRYMSPEQLGADGRPVDSRTDVYSLGVILFELFTGSHPHGARDTPPLEAARGTRETTPPLIGKMVPACRGDLSIIVAHALEKDRDRRYATAAELAADLRRVQRHEPITARRSSIWYPIGRWVRRHRGLASLTLLAAASVVVAVGVIITSQRRRLDERRDTIVSLTKLIGPNPSASRELPYLEFLGRLENELEVFIRNDPVSAAAIHERLGVAYWNLSQHERAAEHLTRALSFHREISPELDVSTLRVANILGDILNGAGRYEEAMALADEWLTRTTKAWGDGHEQTLRFATNLADARMGARLDREAEETYRKIYELACQHLSRAHPDRAEIAASHARASLRLGQLETAERLAREALALQLAAQGPTNPATLWARVLVGEILIEQGRLSEADRELVEANQVIGTVTSPLNRVNIEARFQLASLRERQNDRSTAAALLREVVRDARTVLPENHWRRAAYEAAFARYGESVSSP